jgi:Na+/proline symporter
MSGGQNNPKTMHELKTSEPAESAVRSSGIVVPLLLLALAIALIITGIAYVAKTGDEHIGTIIIVAALIPSKLAKYIRRRKRHNADLSHSARQNETKP